MLDRLMRGAVFAKADGIVGKHEDGADAHQRRHAQRAAAIVRESEERAAIGDDSAVQRHAIHDRRHDEFAHAVMQIVAVRVAADRLRTRPQRQVGAREISRAADQLRQERRQRLDRVLRRLARSDRLGLLFRVRKQRDHACLE